MIKALVSVEHFNFIPSSATHSSVNFCPIFKTRSQNLSFCLTNDTKVSDLLVLRTKIYDFKLMYFFGTPGSGSCNQSQSIRINYEFNQHLHNLLLMLRHDY